MHDLLRLPIDASAHGPEIDNMIVVIHWLMLVLFVGWGSFFAFVLVRFRKSKNQKADHDGIKSHFSSYLEIGVAIFEAVLLIGFAFPLWAKRVNQVPDEKTATVVRVVAEQFAWNIHYPGTDGIFGRTDIKLVSAENPLGLDRSDPYAKDDITTINQLNLPLGKPVVLHLSSKDVIHSFNLPLFRVKQDVIPGEVIRAWFIPTMTTEQIRAQSIQHVQLREGSYPSVLAATSAVQDYTAKDGTPIVSKGGSISEETVAQLLQAGISSVVVAPDTPTEIACAQLCGLGHFRMRGFVTIQTPDEYQAWLNEQAAQLVQQAPSN